MGHKAFEILVRLLAAGVIGGLIGYERRAHQRRSASPGWFSSRSAA
jgi:uncharacterized membrane protein YhiD involved in acid resistance